jgi:hypothetical protein
MLGWCFVIRGETKSSIWISSKEDLVWKWYFDGLFSFHFYHLNMFLFLVIKFDTGLFVSMAQITFNVKHLFRREQNIQNVPMWNEMKCSVKYPSFWRLALCSCDSFNKGLNQPTLFCNWYFICCKIYSKSSQNTLLVSMGVEFCTTFTSLNWKNEFDLGSRGKTNVAIKSFEFGMIFDTSTDFWSRNCYQ